MQNLYLGRQWFKEFIFDLLNILYIRIYLIIIIFINLLLWILVSVIDIQTEQDLIALHYNVDFGVNLIGGAGRVYIIPLIGVIIILINGFLTAAMCKQKDGQFIAHVLLSAVVLVHIFLLAAAASIYLINFI